MTVDTSGWIVAQRPAREALNPLLPHGFFTEQELSAAGRILNSGTILLTNSECPWHCLMCDLWKQTLPHRVPSGAISAQIQYALARLNPRPEQLKLYNSGSFFDPGAIPPEEYPQIARTVAVAAHIVVESHPRLIGEKALRFRDLVSGSLEVAMGLETVHPAILPRLNKRFTLKHFAAAADFLRKELIAVRAFVLLKPPFSGDDQAALEWIIKSVAFAFECGAAVVSVIPTRAGNGVMEGLMDSGQFAPPSLTLLERALELSLGRFPGRVFADAWNLEQFSTCSVCLPARRERLQAMNLAQRILPAIHCANCGA